MGPVADCTDDGVGFDGLTVRKGDTFGCRFLDACSKDRFYAALAQLSLREPCQAVAQLIENSIL